MPEASSAIGGRVKLREAAGELVGFTRQFWRTCQGCSFASRSSTRVPAACRACSVLTSRRAARERRRYAAGVADPLLGHYGGEPERLEMTRARASDRRQRAHGEGERQPFVETKEHLGGFTVVDLDLPDDTQARSWTVS